MSIFCYMIAIFDGAHPSIIERGEAVLCRQTADNLGVDIRRLQGAVNGRESFLCRNSDERVYAATTFTGVEEKLNADSCLGCPRCQ
jgi:hypothetical protein